MRRLVMAVVVAAAATATGASAHPFGEGEGGTAATPDASGRFVPDLVQILPSRVGIAHRRGFDGGRRTLLTFAGAVENYGTGPLVIRASRPGTDFRTMSARQIVVRSDGTTERVGNVGRLRYIRGGGHRHWHLQGFMSYSLRTVGGVPLRRGRKAGFCLGDRYDANGAAHAPGEPAGAVFTTQCGRSRPGRLSLTEGISVGFGDVYGARLAGQSVDITGLRSGRYVLVQRVDPHHRLLDLHRDNDVSSMLVQITRRGPRTHARIRAWCTSTDRCPTPEVGG